MVTSMLVTDFGDNFQIMGHLRYWWPILYIKKVTITKWHCHQHNCSRATLVRIGYIGVHDIFWRQVMLLTILKSWWPVHTNIPNKILFYAINITLTSFAPSNGIRVVGKGSWKDRRSNLESFFVWNFVPSSSFYMTV